MDRQDRKYGSVEQRSVLRTMVFLDTRVSIASAAEPKAKIATSSTINSRGPIGNADDAAKSTRMTHRTPVPTQRRVLRIGGIEVPTLFHGGLLQSYLHVASTIRGA